MASGSGAGQVIFDGSSRKERPRPAASLSSSLMAPPPFPQHVSLICQARALFVNGVFLEGDRVFGQSGLPEAVLQGHRAASVARGPHHAGTSADAPARAPHLQAADQRAGWHRSPPAPPQRRESDHVLHHRVGRGKRHNVQP